MLATPLLTAGHLNLLLALPERLNSSHTRSSGWKMLAIPNPSNRSPSEVVQLNRSASALPIEQRLHLAEMLSSWLCQEADSHRAVAAEHH